MELPSNPEPWLEKDAGDHEQTAQDFTPVDTGIRVILADSPQAAPQAARVNEDELLIASFCEV